MPVPLTAALELAAKAINDAPVSSQPVVASQSKPPFAVSLVDGIAVASNFDQREPGIVTEIVLRHEDHQLDDLNRQNVAYVATGAKLPPNTHCVIKIENFLQIDSLQIGSSVLLLDEEFEIQKGTYIAQPGTDVQEGDLLVPRGVPWRGGELSAYRFAAASSEPIPSISIRLKVTGAEVIKEPQSEYSPVSVLDCNGPIIEDICKGYRNVSLSVDEPGDEFIKELYFGDNGCTEDLLIFTGGISAGIHDEVINALNEESIPIVFRKIQIKPGMPTTFGMRTIHDKVQFILCLPGNPCGCFVAGHLVLKPILHMLMGRLGGVDLVKEFPSFLPQVTPISRVVSPSPIQPSSDGRLEFVRCFLQRPVLTLSDILGEGFNSANSGAPNSGTTATVLGYQRSTTPTSLSICNGLLVVPPTHRDGDQLYVIELEIDTNVLHSGLSEYLRKRSEPAR